jgi:[acyl-carrier-protein] S-malonyltransferase
MLERLVNQVTLPVRWDLCVSTMAKLGVTATAELPPAGALTGLVKRQLKITNIALKTPDDLAKVAEAHA